MASAALRSKLTDEDISVNFRLVHLNTDLLFAIMQQAQIKAAIQVVCGSLLVLLCSITASLIIITDRWILPHDFVQKGTLSNASQNVTSPHGRLFTVGLIFGSILFLTSSYTFVLYSSWGCHEDKGHNPFDLSAMQPWGERRWRALWVCLPQLGFMLTGACPSLSGAKGTELALSTVHNTAAPLSMAFMVIMETVQLAQGEHAFRRWLGKPSPKKGPLTAFQRLRLAACVLAWLCASIFLGIQVYMGILDIILGKANKSFPVAAVSFYAEVACLNLAFLIPALKGLEFLTQTGKHKDEESHALTAQAMEVIRSGDYTQWNGLMDSSSENSDELCLNA